MGFHVKLQVLWDCETLTAPMLGFVCESDEDLECESRKPMNLQFDMGFHVKLQVLWDCETPTAPMLAAASAAAAAWAKA